MIITGGSEMETEAESQQVHFPLESVLEEAEEEDENQNKNNALTSRDEITPTTRVPSQRSRAILIRTPANELDQSESPLEFPNDEEENNERTDILITEVKENDYGSDIESDEEEEELVFEQETNKPQLTEDDYDTDLEIDEQAFYHDTTGKSNYLKICQQYGIVPISYFVRHIVDNEITMRYHGLSPTAAKAIALVLRVCKNL